MPIIHLIHQWGRPKTRRPTKEHFDHHFADGLFHRRVIILISPNQWANGHLSISASLNIANGLVQLSASEGQYRHTNPRGDHMWSKISICVVKKTQGGKYVLCPCEGPTLISYWSKHSEFDLNYPTDRLPAQVFVSGSILRAFKGLHRYDHQVILWFEGVRKENWWC